MAQEKNYENKIKSYLESIGVYPFGTASQDITTPIIGYYEKRWGGGKFSKSGLPDMHIVIRGESIELEIKAPDGKPSELQLKNLDLIVKSGGIGYVTVELYSTAVILKKWISVKYPQYSHIQVICFKELQNLCESFF